MSSLLNLPPSSLFNISSSPVSAIAVSNLTVSTIPLALYIHIPWCVKKCPYCDFNSHTLPPLNPLTSATDALFADYVTALIEDIDSQLRFVQHRDIASIFIGGGTPSLLPIAQYQRLFKHLRQVLSFAPDIEITMEANPGTLEHAPFAEYLSVGINRLSIGVQSFADAQLKGLGRIHDAKQALNAIASARQAGFKRLNVDLMHGLPKQNVAAALDDIHKAHNAGATHISWYQLTIEPNTVFYRSTPILPDEDNLAAIEQQGRDLLQQLGYRNYEISAWVGGDDTPCQHNLNYWQFGDYLAIGAGAHGKVTLAPSLPEAVTNPIYRFSKSRLPKDYMASQNASNATNEKYPKMATFQPIATDEMASEFMLNALRLTQGVSTELYSMRTGHDFATIKPIVQQLQKQGLLVDKEEVICATILGNRYLNSVLQAFI